MMFTSPHGEGTIVGPLFFILVLAPISSVIMRATKNVITNTNTFGIKIEKEMFDITSREYADDVSGILCADNDEILQVAATETMKQFKQFFFSYWNEPKSSENRNTMHWNGFYFLVDTIRSML